MQQKDTLRNVRSNSASTANDMAIEQTYALRIQSAVSVDKSMKHAHAMKARSNALTVTENIQHGPKFSIFICIVSHR